MICSVCKKGFAKTPRPCDKCGQPTCAKCGTSQIPPGRWEIRYSVKIDVAGRLHVCKNCIAEKALTEDA